MASVPATLKLNQGESVILDETPSAFWTWPLYVFTLGLWSIWRSRHRFILTSQRVIVRKGIISKSEQTVQLARIQDVNVVRSLIAGGSIAISSAGGALSIRKIGPLTRAKAAEFAEKMSDSLPTRGEGLGSAPAATSASVADEIAKLVALRDSGAITDEEFTAHKESWKGN